MNWNSNDNKGYRGPIDRAFVSLTEPYERSYFVDEWLKSRKYKVDDNGRAVVNRVIDNYTGRAPIKRADLEKYLDANISPKK